MGFPVLGHCKIYILTLSTTSARRIRGLRRPVIPHDNRRHIIEQLIQGSLAELKSKRKDISAADYKQISDMVANLRVTQKKLVDIYEVVQKYNVMMDSYKDYTTNSDLSINKMRQLVRRNQKLLERNNKGEMSLMTILRSINSLIEQQSDNQQAKPLQL